MEDATDFSSASAKMERGSLDLEQIDRIDCIIGFWKTFGKIGQNMTRDILGIANCIKMGHVRIRWITQVEGKSTSTFVLFVWL